MNSISSTRSTSPAAVGRTRTSSPPPKVPLKLFQLSSPPSALPGQSPVAPSLTSSPTVLSVQSIPSVQSSPDGPQPLVGSAQYPATFQLPESVLISPTIPSQNFQEASPQPQGKQGLIRRVSSRAMNAPNRLLRHRQSSNNVIARDRDQSSGPLVMRRQSSAANTTDIDGAEAGFDHSTVQISGGMFQPASPQFVEPYFRPAASHATPVRPFGDFDDSYGIVNKSLQVSDTLKNGTKLLKVTRRKKKELLFVLDPGSVKLSWHPTDSSKRLYIDDILEIRTRAEARNYREEFGCPEEWERRWFTIIYTDPGRSKGRAVKIMHLVARTQAIFETWTTNLLHIIDTRQKTMQGLASGREDKHDEILPQLWRREMTKRRDTSTTDEATKPFSPASSQFATETLDLPGILTVCRSLHMDCSDDCLREHFDAVKRSDEDKDQNPSGLTYDQFKRLFRRLKERSEIHEIFSELLEPGQEGLSLMHFLNFVRDTQGAEVASQHERWSMIFYECIRRHNPSNSESPTSTRPELMEEDAFASFLGSAANDILRPTTELPRLDKPLSQYFISSSHNTYLMGRQVVGMSSTEAYVTALKKGCRCVEIDCWDGDDGLPTVTHGHTMTSQVPFKDCVQAISKYAFTASEYPLILSLEVHCSPVQQQIMRTMMEREFGERLVRVPINELRALPSPEELKGRVLVKVKASTPDVQPTPLMPSATPSAPGHTRRQRSMSSPQARHVSVTTADLPLLSSPPTLAPLDLSAPVSRPSFSSSVMASSGDESDFAFAPGSAQLPPPKPPKSKIIKTLGELGVYTAGYKYRNFGYPESKAFNHVFSLSEGDFEKLSMDAETSSKVERHNAKFLMRVYPGKMRIRSSNFDPLICWRKGVQMAALNWQTYDFGMQLNDAMFASEADSRGYVLKPKELRSGGLSDSQDDGAGWAKGHKQKIKFSLELISGQQLPRPRSTHPDMIGNPYVDIELICAEDKTVGIASGEGGSDASRSGASGIGAPHRRRSRIIDRNGYNPIFKDTFKLSLDTSYPSLVFVRCSVWSSPDGRTFINSEKAAPLATFTAKLSDLGQGYRYLPLFDQNGEKLLSTLFCKIEKAQPVSLEPTQPDRTADRSTGRMRGLTNSLRRAFSNGKKDAKYPGLERRPSAIRSRQPSDDKLKDMIAKEVAGA